MPSPSRILRAARNLATTHATGYPAGFAVHPIAGWSFAVLCPVDGVPFVALGGERAGGYRLGDGTVVEGFELRPGEIATRLRTGLPHHLAEWRIERPEEER